MPRIVHAEVTGLEQVIKRLLKLPDRARRHALRPALGKAATIVAKKARSLAPTGEGMTPDGRPRPHLKKTIKKTRVKYYPSTETLLAVVGPEKNAAPHAHLVHDGTRPHEITLSRPLVLNNVVLPPGFVIHHPGAKADPFLQQAVTLTRGAVVSKLKTEIPKGIEKQTRKLRGLK